MEFASRVRVLLLMSLFALVVEFVPVASVHAQSPRVVRVVCPEAALNVPLYERALAQRIRTLIDRNLYKQERVRVTLRRVGVRREFVPAPSTTY